MKKPPITKRGLEWQEFSSYVFNHINSYTVPQYGDKGEDQIDNWPIEVCMLQVIKYMKRINNNQRPGQELQDMLKAAHYISFIFHKLKKGGSK